MQMERLGQPKRAKQPRQPSLQACYLKTQFANSNMQAQNGAKQPRQPSLQACYLKTQFANSNMQAQNGAKQPSSNLDNPACKPVT